MSDELIGVSGGRSKRLRAMPDGSVSEVVTAVSGLIIAAAEFSRPADTTAYAARDAVTNSTSATALMAFALGRIAGGSGYLVRARLATNRATDTARFRLWLFRVSNPTSVPNDNAAFALLWANRAQIIGFLDFPALSTEGTGSDAAVAVIADARLAFSCAAADTQVYGLLEALDVFTPASGQQFSVQLAAEVN
jgi:hypothetical protein